MKSVLVLFLFLASSFLVFADPIVSTKTVYASLEIETILPSYTIHGGLSENAITAIGSSSIPAGTINTEATYAVNLGESYTTVYVRVMQFGRVHYLCEEGFLLNITATELKLDGTSNDYKTDPPTVMADKVLPGNQLDVDGDTVFDFVSELQYPIDENDSDPRVSYRITYPTGMLIPALVNGNSVLVGGCAFNWEISDDLPGGDYAANITLTYQTP